MDSREGFQSPPGRNERGTGPFAAESRPSIESERTLSGHLSLVTVHTSPRTVSAMFSPPIDRSDSGSSTSDSAPRSSGSVLPPMEAQVRGLTMLFPISLLALGPYFTLWGVPEAPFPTDPGSALLFLAAFVVGIFLHEGLHGIGYVLGRASWTDLRFGMHWDALTPFARCEVPTRVETYRLAVALPGIVLGAIPVGIGVSTGFWPATFYGFLMLVAAAGDILMLWLLRVVPSGTWVQDHPREVGYVVVADVSASPPPPISDDELVEEQSAKEDGLSLRYVAFLLVLPLMCVATGLLLAAVLA